MQQVLSKKLIGLLLAGSLLITNARAHDPVSTELKTGPLNLATGFIILSSLYLYTILNYKKTQPQRVYPKDGSLLELLKFIHDELLVGQKYLPERAAGAHVDPLDPDHVINEYTKIEARGLAGQTEYYMTKVIVPSVVLAIAYQKLKGDIATSWRDITMWWNNPEELTKIPVKKVIAI